METVSVGDLTSSVAHPREVFKPCIRRNAAAVALAHNHPSGDPRPSQEDVLVTERLVEAGKLLGIEVLDHVILADGRYVSLRQAGLGWERGE
jgi:DNA repair protein RadC